VVNSKSDKLYICYIPSLAAK